MSQYHWTGPTALGYFGNRGYTMPRGTPFVDNFDDNSLDPAKWNAPVNERDIVIAETSTELRLTHDASYTAPINGSYIQSFPTINFFGKQLEVQWASGTANIGANSSGSGATYVQIYDTNNVNNYAQIRVEQGNMHYTRSNNGVLSTLSGSGANFVNNVSWKIVHVAATNVWEFYTGNSTPIYNDPANFISAAANWNPTATKIQIGAYTYGSNQNNRVSRMLFLTSTGLY